MTPLQSLAPNPDVESVLREYMRRAGIFHSVAGGRGNRAGAGTGARGGAACIRVCGEEAPAALIGARARLVGPDLLP
jgi:hypothetical protein